MRRKIVFFIESLKIGGAEKSLLSLLNNLEAGTYDVDLVIIQKGGELEKFIPKWINFKPLKLKYSLTSRIYFKILNKLHPKTHKAQLFWKAFEGDIEALEDEYDVAIGWGQGFATYFTAEKIKAKKKFAWVNVDYDKAGYKFKYDKPIYKKIDKIIAISDYVKGLLKNYIPNDKIEIIPNIIDSTEVISLSEMPIKSNQYLQCSKFKIVSVGRLAKPKAFDLAIETAHCLKKRKVDFSWFIIGEGSERKYLEGLIEKKGLKDTVILLGFRENPYPYIKFCDIYVQTSLFEGLGRTLIEASILSKPIVSTNFPTVYGIIEDEKTGLIAEMNAEDIAGKIERLILNPDLKNGLVESLKRQINTDKEITLRKVQELLES